MKDGWYQWWQERCDPIPISTTILTFLLTGWQSFAVKLVDSPINCLGSSSSSAKCCVKLGDLFQLLSLSVHCFLLETVTTYRDCCEIAQEIWGTEMVPETLLWNIQSQKRFLGFTVGRGLYISSIFAIFMGWNQRAVGCRDLVGLDYKCKSGIYRQLWEVGEKDGNLIFANLCSRQVAN
jgi:hypothetical protein